MTEDDFPLQLRGRCFTLTELGLIRNIISCMPSKNRTEISREICAQLNWRQVNGNLKDAACREVLLKLHRAHLITLPPPKRIPNRLKPVPPSRLTDSKPIITVSVDKLNPIELMLITNNSSNRLFREYMDRYHYLGHQMIVGPQLRYIIGSREHVLGCIAFAAAAWCVKPRDQWIGWNHQLRKQNLCYIINNVRFLILPWIKSPNLASRILALCAKQVPQDWQQRYGYSPLLFETFVEKKRCQGTCYQAANWIYVGDTQGRGKRDRLNQYLLPTKAIYLFPVVKDARQRLCNIKTI